MDAVEIVRKALLSDWFPNGHGGESDDRLRNDWEEWQRIAGLDAQTAVDALVNAGLICIAGDDVYDGDKSEDK